MMAPSTAITAVMASAVWMSRRNRRRSDRDCRTTAAGVPPLALVAVERDHAGRRCAQQRGDGREVCGNQRAGQRPAVHREDDLRVGRTLELLGTPAVEQEPDAQAADD